MYDQLKKEEHLVLHSQLCVRLIKNDTPPATTDAVLWHVAINSQQYSPVEMTLLQRHSVYDGPPAIAALQRCCVVQNAHRGDI